MSIRTLSSVLVLLVAVVACKGKSADKPPSVEAEVWSLSHDLGQALLLASAGQPDKAKPMFDNVSARATKLVGVAPAELPVTSSPFQADLVKHYSDYTTGRGLTLREAIKNKLGEPRAALFDLGLDSQIVGAWIANIEEEKGRGPLNGPLNASTWGEPLRASAASAGVPADLLEPLLAKLKAGAPSREVQDEVNKLHDAVPKLIADGKLKPPGK